MKWLGIRFLLVMVVLLSSGKMTQPFKNMPILACEHPDILFSYLDMDRINSTYPNANHKQIIDGALLMIKSKQRKAIPDSFIHLVRPWFNVCLARGPEEEDLAWKNFASEIKHMMHIDQSIFDITKYLLGDKTASRLGNPHKSFMQSDDFSVDDCVERLNTIFYKHCCRFKVYAVKHFLKFFAMCKLGVEEGEFVDATLQVCGNSSLESN